MVYFRNREREPVAELSPAFYKGLIEHNPDAILAIDEDGRAHFANPATAELFARPISQIVGLPFGFPISGGVPQEVEIIRPDGLPRIVEMRVGKVLYRTKMYHIASLRDITELALQRLELSALSFTDDLTGLYNRRGFLILAGNQLKLAQRKGQCLSLVYLDLDGLKQINDTQSHAAGDQALMATADIMRRAFRETDIKARLGGDEFVALAVDADKNAAGNLIARLEEAVLAFNQSGKQPFLLSISLGVSEFTPQQPATLKELLERADAGLHRQKEIKKGRAP